MKRGNGSADAAELFAQSKSHDPHCYVRVDLYNVPVEACQCCKSIASARADEREQAAQRLLDWFRVRRIDVVNEAVAAARGETS